MLRWSQLDHLSDDELRRLDIALVNLICALGLPGGESIDVAICLQILDRWAERIRQETKRLAPRFHQEPQLFDHSRGRFQALVMGTVLQREFGVHYSQELIALDDAAFFRQAAHLFIHGVIQGNGGTCTSLPPVYLAVGRRLGYPLKLVHTKRHFFVRWDDPSGERFNIETTSAGVNFHSDDHYRQWPLPVTPDDEHRFGALRSLRPRQEVACSVGVRANCCAYNKLWRDAVFAYACACQMCPDDRGWSSNLIHTMNQWDRHLRAQMMLGFPSVTIYFPPRWFPAIPVEAERGIIHMIVKEELLSRPDLDLKQAKSPLKRRGVHEKNSKSFGISGV
jgi:hypothetical protein